MYQTLVEPEILAAHLSDPQWVTVDCRFDLKEPDIGRHAYDALHIPGARYAHLEDDLSGARHGGNGRHPLPDPDRLAETFGAWGIDSARQVVAYDDANGALAARLWWLLRWLGHERAAVLNGGLKAWKAAKLPLTPEPTAVTPAKFVARVKASASVDSAFIAAGIGQKTYRLIDARSAARFRGETEPFDPVAGHVPGAVNRPFDRNLDKSGKFLPPAQLQAEFRELARVDGGQIVHMCGSGVTACHNLLAMEYAGIANSLLYVGSWSEWVADPQRPVATGPD